jgi:hypothetical protein
MCRRRSQKRREEHIRLRPVFSACGAAVGMPSTERKALAKMSEAATIERLERGLALCAYLVVLDDPVVMPLFDNLERELAAIRRNSINSTDRAVADFKEGANNLRCGLVL